MRSIAIDTARFVTTDHIANAFDMAAVHADALPEDLAAIDMADVKAQFYGNVIN